MASPRPLPGYLGLAQVSLAVTLVCQNAHHLGVRGRSG